MFFLVFFQQHVIDFDNTTLLIHIVSQIFYEPFQTFSIEFYSNRVELK